jgi:hypothetical protein
MLHDSCWQRRLRKLVRAGAVAILLAALTTEKAAAADADGVDVVVQVLPLLLGAPVNEADVTVIKFIVGCAANSTTIVKCARSEVIDQLHLPTEVKPLADCILDGTPLEKCPSKDLLNGLGLPATVQQLLACISHTGDVGTCANQAVTAEEHQILDVIDKLKADARSDAMTELDAAGHGFLRNIISLSKAIDADDWPGVAFYGGTEVYTAAAKAVLKIVLPEIFQTFSAELDPIIDALIQARADALAKVIAAAKKHDLGRVNEAILEAYMSDSAVVICSTLLEISEDIKEAVCGPIGKIIHSIADAGGAVTDLVLNAITHPLNIPKDILELFGDVINVVGDVVHVFDPPDPPDPQFCPTPNQYYATSYARCYHRGVRQLSSSTAQFDQLVSSVNQRCQGVDHYTHDHCFKPDKANQICSPQGEMFSNHVKQLVSSVESAANSYKNYFRQFVSELAREQGLAAACDRQSAFQKFLDDCAKQVAVQVPLLGDPDSDDCDTHSSPFFARVAHRAACERAMAQVDTDATLRDVCAPIVALTADNSLLGETVTGTIEPILPP